MSARAGVVAAGHADTAAAAAEVLTILEEESLVDRARETGARLGTMLAERFAQHPHVAEVRGRGLLQAIEIVRDVETLEPYPRDDNLTGRLVGAALKRGVFFYGGGTGVGTF